MRRLSQDEMKSAQVQGQGILMPPPDLEHLVKYIWYFVPEIMNRPARSFRIVPSGCPGLIFNHAEGKSAVRRLDGQFYPVAFLHGQDTEPCINQDHSSSTMISVRLYPMALKQLFGVDAHELKDRVVPLNDFAGFDLTERFVNAANLGEQLHSILEFLRHKLKSVQRIIPEVAESLNLITENLSLVTPSSIYKSIRISERQFQRKFRQYVGVSLEMYIRIQKFQRSLQWLQQGSFQNLSDLAYDLGYFDQSHFIREFKAFSDLSPGNMFKKLSATQGSVPEVLSKSIKTVRFIYTS
jgi:AraC-like DNA-binding protein